MQGSAPNVSVKVAEYEQFLQTRLETDLNVAFSVAQALTQEQEDYQALGQNIQLLLKVCDTKLALLVHLCCLLDLNSHAGQNL